MNPFRFPTRADRLSQTFLCHSSLAAFLQLEENNEPYPINKQKREYLFGANFFGAFLYFALFWSLFVGDSLQQGFSGRRSLSLTFDVNFKRSTISGQGIVWVKESREFGLESVGEGFLLVVGLVSEVVSCDGLGRREMRRQGGGLQRSRQRKWIIR